jgi:hypothetical protein
VVAGSARRRLARLAVGSWPGRTHRALADAGQPSGGLQGDLADRVAVVANEPLDAPCRSHIRQGQGVAVPAGEGHGDAVAAEINGGLATGCSGGEGDSVDEPRGSGEVVEVEGLPDVVAVALPARQVPQGGRGRVPRRWWPWLPLLRFLLDGVSGRRCGGA